MKNIITLLATILTSIAISQAPVQEWQNTIGGDDHDKVEDIAVASDGGFLVAGSSYSGTSGDKTEAANGDKDFWVVKINTDGIVQWDKTFGGSDFDRLARAIQTSDGGFILVGFSYSDISGNKSENSEGGSDCWVIKISSTGILEWQNTIGGLGYDRAQSISETSDGGFILGGISRSDISGDKTENSHGDNDYWILKLDVTGVIVWQNTIGGSDDDYLNDIIQTADGGYIMCGHSTSDISGDKTENSMGERDYWIVKTNATGTIEWQNTIGGINNDRATGIVQTTDGGYIVAGTSGSNISGDKTDPSNGESDIWVVKIDATGQSILWQNSIGGFDDDFATHITATADGNFIIGGSSSSEISGDKTESNRSAADIWGVKINNQGNIIWDKTFGARYDNDDPAKVYPTPDNGYIFGAGATWEIFGDKTEEGINMSFDFWVIKLEGDSLSLEDEVQSIVSIYPNPVKDRISINFKDSYNTIDITVNDILGRQVIFENFRNTNTIQMDMNIPSGIYIVNIDNHKDNIRTYKIIKE